MAKIPLVCLLISFLCLSCLDSAASEPDYYVLTLMWPGAYCKDNSDPGCCLPTPRDPAEDFYVYALVPYNSSGEPLTDCNTTECRFYVNKLKNLVFELNTYWPDLSCPSNNGMALRKSVWCTYGLCSNFSANQTAYFERALQLRSVWQPLQRLENNSIVPSDSEKYSLEDIEDALTSGYTTAASSIFIECNRDPSSLESQLYKINVCLSADATSTIDCPFSTDSTCDANVLFVPFTLPSAGANPIKMPTQEDVAA